MDDAHDDLEPKEDETMSENINEMILDDDIYGEESDSNLEGGLSY